MMTELSSTSPNCWIWVSLMPAAATTERSSSTTGGWVNLRLSWVPPAKSMPRLSLPWTKTEKMPITRNTDDTPTKKRRYFMKSIWLSRKNSMALYPG